MVRSHIQESTCRHYSYMCVLDLQTDVRNKRSFLTPMGFNSAYGHKTETEFDSYAAKIPILLLILTKFCLLLPG